MNPAPVRALAVDDNILVRAGLVSLLEATGTVTVVGEAGNGREAIEKAVSLGPDVTLLDVRMPLLDGVGAVEELVKTAPVLMLTHTEEPETIQAALRNGASGYLVHGAFTADELSEAILEVVAGRGNPLSPVAVSAMLSALRYPAPTGNPAQDASAQDHSARLGLSQRECEILALIAQGLSNAEIAKELFLAEKTVKNHVSHIYAKLNVSSRAAAIASWNGVSRSQVG